MPSKPAYCRIRKPVPTAWAQVIDQWATAMTSAGLTSTVIGQRCSHLRQLARVLDTGPWTTTTPQLTVFVDGRRWSPATRRNYVKTFRAFYRWAVDTGHADHDPAAPITLTLTDTEDAEARAQAITERERPLTGPEPLDVPEPWALLLSEYRRYRLAAGAPRTTVGLRLSHMRQTARALDPIPPEDVTTDDLIDWMAARPWQNETRRAIRSSLRSFFSWAAKSGRIDHDPTADLPSVSGSYPLPRPVTEDDYVFALQLADARERLILRMAAELGMRRAEVARVHTRDLVDTETGRGLIVHGKGNKRRVLPLPKSLALELSTRPPGYVFPSGTDGHLSPAWVGKIVRNLLPAGASMHQLRHRFATCAHTASGDLLTVQQLLGHASPATTQRYVMVSDGNKREVVEAVADVRTRRRGARSPTTTPDSIR